MPPFTDRGSALLALLTSVPEDERPAILLGLRPQQAAFADRPAILEDSLRALNMYHTVPLELQALAFELTNTPRAAHPLTIYAFAPLVEFGSTAPVPNDRRFIDAGSLLGSNVHAALQTATSGALPRVSGPPDTTDVLPADDETLNLDILHVSPFVFCPREHKQCRVSLVFALFPHSRCIRLCTAGPRNFK